MVNALAAANEETNDIKANTERFGLLSIFFGSVRTLNPHF